MAAESGTGTDPTATGAATVGGAADARPFEYGQPQELLRASARRLVAERFSSERVRALMETERAHDTEAWQAMGALGWHGLLVPEEHGGVGLGLLDLGVLLEELGAAVVPGPYLAAQLATLVLLAGASDEQRARWLPHVADGSLVPTLALLEPGAHYEVAGGGVVLRRDGGGAAAGGSLTGTKLGVLDAQSADLLLVSAGSDAGPTLVAVDAASDGVRIVPDELVDETRRSATVTFDGVLVETDAIVGGAAGAAATILDVALPRLWAALSAELVGCARRALGMSVEYARVREQFGRPIGSFQAVKHRLVDRMVEVENARSLVYGALWAQDHEPARAARLARMAKAYLSDVGPRVGDTAVRTHGGIGFTWECDVHLYWKRLHWGRHAYGDGPYHRAAIAAELAGG